MATVLITGGTQGLGFEAAKVIAQGAPKDNIILASRTNPIDAASSINAETGANTASFVPLDLSSLQDVRSFVNHFVSKKHPPIRALYLNAGLQVLKGLSYTEDGFETTFGINHLGHALLFYLLRPHLTNDCHIIITSSGTHDPNIKTMVPDAVYTSAEELARPPPEIVNSKVPARDKGLQRYATSKLVNVLWMYALYRHINEAVSSSAGPKWTVAAFDPGLMPGTGLARDNSPVMIFLWKHILPYMLPLLRMMLDSNVHKVSESGFALAALENSERRSQIDGEYYSGLKPIESSKASHDIAKQDDIWEWTIKTLAMNAEEKQSFEQLIPAN